jgi:hypothetical protein
LFLPTNTNPPNKTGADNGSLSDLGAIFFNKEDYRSAQEQMVEDSTRFAEELKLTFGKVGQILAIWPKQPQLPVAVNG